MRCLYTAIVSSRRPIVGLHLSRRCLLTSDDGSRRTLFINEASFDAPARYRSTRDRGRAGAGYRLTIDRIVPDDDARYTCEIQQLAKASAHLTVLGITVGLRRMHSP